MKNEEEELREFLQAEKKEEKKSARIFFDGKQFNMRIPKRFAEVIETAYKKNLTDFLFEFTLEKPPALSKDHYPKLRGVLKSGEEIKET